MENAISVAQIQTSLTKEQKEAVGLLSVGTFFEQFDIMLYIHMAVLLNELFFPKTDTYTASLLSAVTFCSTFIFIPIGALLFGYIGDNIGRRPTVVITTLLTAVSCLTIAFLPTYEEIGLKASIIMIGCRVVQSIASMGEVIGAMIYISEFTKPPIRYYAVAIIPVLGYTGGLVALGVASMILYSEINWRSIFIFGAFIALIGITIRTKLSESRDFSDANKRLKSQYNLDINEDSVFIKDSSYKKTLFGMFCVQCAWPLCFYFVFIYCSQVLRANFQYTSLDIIKHNFVISIFPVISCFIRANLSKKIHPLIILKYSIFFSFILFGITGFYLEYKVTSILGIGVLQSLLLMFTPNGYSESSIMFTHAPIFKRFKSACMSYALSRAFMYIATSFGLIFIINALGAFWGLCLIAFCVSCISMYGYYYFLKLEQIDNMI